MGDASRVHLFWTLVNKVTVYRDSETVIGSNKNRDILSVIHRVYVNIITRLERP
jgi:hypothetical protein